MSESKAQWAGRDVIADTFWTDICPCCHEANVYQVGEETGLLDPDGTVTKAKNIVYDAAEVVFEIIEGPYTGVKLHYLRKKPN